jgi:hypothetical protein
MQYVRPYMRVAFGHIGPRERILVDKQRIEEILCDFVRSAEMVNEQKRKKRK